MSFKFESITSITTRSHLGSTDRFQLRFDNKHSYFVLPEGIWRGPARLNSGAMLFPLKLPKGEIQNFYVINDTWFLLKEPSADGRVFMRSNDEGATWQPMDDGLEIVSGNHKTRLVATRMTQQQNVVFLNAGGGINFMSSSDGGKCWSSLVGNMSIQMASAGKFLVQETNVILGGEAPLDMAYLNKGELHINGVQWIKQPQSVAPDGLENRNIQFIESHFDGKSFFAGVEGGVLKSDDRGASWRWVQRFTQSDPKYPYIQHICFGDVSNGLMWVSGWDKPNDSLPYLSVSMDGGETWMDISNILMRNPDWRNALMLQRDYEGRILIGVFDPKKDQVEIGLLIKT